MALWFTEVYYEKNCANSVIINKILSYLILMNFGVIINIIISSAGEGIKVLGWDKGA